MLNAFVNNYPNGNASFLTKIFKGDEISFEKDQDHNSLIPFLDYSNLNSIINTDMSLGKEWKIP